MLYEEPRVEVLFETEDLPYTDLIDASGSGEDYEYGSSVRTFG